MSGHGNTGKHLAELPKTVQRRLIEQAIALHGTPYKAAEQLGMPDGAVLEVWRQMNEAAGTADTTLARPVAVQRQPCGTYAAYQFHKSHGQPVDDACWNAASDRGRAYGRRRRGEAA